MFFVIMAVNFLLVGPLLVGIPVLADQRLPEGPVAFGLLMSAYAGGNLGGYLFAGALPRPSAAAIRVLMVALMTAFGCVIGALAFIRATWMDFVLLLIIGLGNGYLSIILITWMQVRTPREMLGRMMSLFMLSNIGLIPVSQALSGALIRWDLNALFLAAGALVLLVTAWMVFQPALTLFSESLASERAAKLPT
jgi:MFS family permease